MEHHSAAVALRTQKTGEAMCASHFQARHLLRDRPDRPGLDLEKRPAWVGRLA